MTFQKQNFMEMYIVGHDRFDSHLIVYIVGHAGHARS